MKWRPLNWDEIKEKVCIFHSSICTDCRNCKLGDLVEAGASAGMEALLAEIDKLMFKYIEINFGLGEAMYDKPLPSQFIQEKLEGKV